MSALNQHDPGENTCAINGPYQVSIFSIERVFLEMDLDSVKHLLIFAV